MAPPMGIQGEEEICELKGIGIRIMEIAIGTGKYSFSERGAQQRNMLMPGRLAAAADRLHRILLRISQTVCDSANHCPYHSCPWHNKFNGSATWQWNCE